MRRLCTWQTGLVMVYLLGAAGLSLWVPATVSSTLDQLEPLTKFHWSDEPDNDGFVADTEPPKSMEKGTGGDPTGAKARTATADPYSAAAAPVAPTSRSTAVTLSPNDVEIVPDGPGPSHLAYVFLWQVDAKHSIRWRRYMTPQFFLALAAAVIFFGIRFRRLLLSAVRIGLRGIGRLVGHRRELCIWLAAGIIAAALLIPPWTAVLKDPELPEMREHSPHRPLWKVAPSRYGWSMNIDYGRMILEILALEALVGALYLTWGRKKG